jgi:hypothetical protein
MTDPVIYTSKGNVPISSLTYQTAWDVQEGYIKFMERYLDSSGEVVKESAHVYDRKGVSADAIAASVG